MVEQELRELIVSKYKSVKAFSEEANLPYTTVDSILKRGVERANVKSIIKLCQALHIDTDALADGRIEPRRVKLKIAITPEEKEFLVKFRSLHGMKKNTVLAVMDLACTSQLDSSSNTIDFPTRTRPEWTVYDQQASAGNGISLWEERATKYYIPESGADCVRYADFGIRVSGDSMEPRFHDGDILMIQKTETLELGEIGVVIMEGEGYVKQIGPGQLISLNPRYAPIPITDNVCITGRVTGVLPYTLDELDPVPSDD